MSYSLPGEIAFGRRPKVAWARERASTLAWLGLTVCSAAAIGIMLGSGQGELALFPVVVLLVLVFAGALPSASWRCCGVSGASWT